MFDNQEFLFAIWCFVIVSSFFFYRWARKKRIEASKRLDEMVSDAELKLKDLISNEKSKIDSAEKERISKILNNLASSKKNRSYR